MRTRFRHSTAGARPFHPADAAGPTDPEPAAAETDGGASAAPAQPEIDPATLETERRKAYQEGYAAGLAERDAAIDTALSQAVEHAGRLASEIGEVRDRVAADAEIDFSQPLQRCLAVLDGAPVVDLQAAGDGGDAGGIAVGRTAAHAAEDPETTDREGDTDERGESAA